MREKLPRHRRSHSRHPNGRRSGHGGHGGQPAGKARAPHPQYGHAPPPFGAEAFLAEPSSTTTTPPPVTILAAVDDLFFSVKITETARKVGAGVRFVKNDKELIEAAGEKPSLIIVDLNSAAMRPIPSIVKLKADRELKKTSVIGFVSHVQGELKQKAHEVGCDMVLARSAFSQNLPNLLRRHGAK
jgi:CheY-like chemotaxis protein